MQARSLTVRRRCRLTTLSMSFQVFSTVLRSAAGCFGGPTASWMASMMPKMRPLLRFGPRPPPGFRPLRAVAMSYVLEDRSQDYRLESDFENVITFFRKPLHLQTSSEATFTHLWSILASLLLNFAAFFHQDSPCHVPTLLIHDSVAKSHCNQITFEQRLGCVLYLCCACSVIVSKWSVVTLLIWVWTHHSTVLLFLGAQSMHLHNELAQVVL